MSGSVVMTIARIPVLATSFASCMLVMVAFLACVLLWGVSYHPAMHQLLSHILVGFPAVTPTGIFVGLIGSLIVGNTLGAIFAVSFNLWNSLAGRRPVRCR
jgi:ammonia channel protein AmtB